MITNKIHRQEIPTMIPTVVAVLPEDDTLLFTSDVASDE